MFFVTRGAIEVLSVEAGLIIGFYTEGNYCGDASILFNKPREFALRAATFCELFSITKVLTTCIKILGLC